MGKIFNKNLTRFILEEMRQCVESGNFVVLAREKNEEFKLTYGLTRQMQQNILLSMRVEDYLSSSESRNFLGRYVHEFCLTYRLCNVDGELENVSIYVKFEIEEEEEPEGKTVVISLHQPERPVSFPFADKKEDMK